MNTKFRWSIAGVCATFAQARRVAHLSYYGSTGLQIDLKRFGPLNRFERADANLRGRKSHCRGAPLKVSVSVVRTPNVIASYCQKTKAEAHGDPVYGHAVSKVVHNWFAVAARTASSTGFAVAARPASSTDSSTLAPFTEQEIARLNGALKSNVFQAVFSVMPLCVILDFSTRDDFQLVSHEL